VVLQEEEEAVVEMKGLNAASFVRRETGKELAS
jgi:hypothetical protein